LKTVKWKTKLKRMLEKIKKLALENASCDMGTRCVEVVLMETKCEVVVVVGGTLKIKVVVKWVKGLDVEQDVAWQQP